MWPFKKKEPAIPFKELIKTYDPAPCGKQYDHYFWTELEWIPCPICSSIAKRAKKREKEKRIASLIAERLFQLQQDAKEKQ